MKIYGENPQSNNRDELIARIREGESNLGAILNVLASRDVDIVAAQIQNDKQPTSIYVDPKTMTISARFGTSHKI